MATSDPIRLQFPAAGLVRKFGFQDQPPWSTCNAQNVRPMSTENERLIGGSRPGLTKAFYVELGSGNPVRLLADVTSVRSGAAVVWSDNFDGEAIGSSWEQISTISLPLLYRPPTAVTTTETVAAAHTAFSDIDVTQAYQIGMYVVPYAGAHHGKYRLYGMMAATTPNPSVNGFIAELTMTGSAGASTITLKKYVASAETAVDSGTASDTAAMEGWFTVVVDGTTVTAYWQGEAVATGTVSGLAGTRVGFGMQATVAGGVTLCDMFRIQYYPVGIHHAVATTLVASANGTLYRERPWIGDMTALVSDLTLATDKLLLGASRGQKLYIADHGRRVKATSVTVDDTGIHLHKADLDWSDYGITTDDDVVVISDGTGGVINGTYTIDSVAAGDDGDLTLTGTGATGDGTCTALVERAPKIYDPDADTLTIWTATIGKGQVPTGCPIIVRYRDRMVLAGAVDAPHVWYMSRSGDALDFDYAADADDGARAVAGNTADAGEMGEPITAMLAHCDDLLVIGCLSSLWCVRGDPAYGGQIDNLSHDVGIVSRGALCRTPEGATVFLSLDGLYILAPGAEVYPTPMSRETLPAELLTIDPSIYTVTMAYDVRFRGIHLYLTPVDSRGQMHWWFDWKTKSFWPVKLQDGHQPTALCSHVSQNVGESRLILGGSDGYLRRYSEMAEHDDGSEIESYVYIGPFRTAKLPTQEGIVSQLDGVLSKRSGRVKWSILAGESGEEAYHVATPQATGTWTAGLNYRTHPRTVGAAQILKLENADANRRWNVEEIAVTRILSGDRTKA